MSSDVDILGFSDAGIVVASTSRLAGARVRFGEITSGLRPIGAHESPLGGQSLLVGTGPDSWNLQESPAGVTLAEVGNAAWLVPGSPAPVLLSVPEDHTGPVTATYRDPDLGCDLPVNPGGDYRLVVRYAAHRADARLVASFVDSDGVILGGRQARLGTHWRGGTSLDDYGRARITFTVPDGVSAVRVTLQYDGRSTRDVRGDGAFVFLTDWRLMDEASPIDGLTPGRARRLLTDPPAHLLAASVPPHLGHGRIPVEIVHAGAVLAATELPDLGQVRMRLRGLVGNLVTVILRGYEGDIHLYIDGERITRRHVTGTRTKVEIPVPERWWDGDLHTIEVRDGSRLRTLARTADLLPTLKGGAWSRSPEPGRARPHQLPVISGLRYQALSEALARATVSEDPQEIRDVITAHQALVLDGDPPLTPLHFPEVGDPDVTVVIPAHNHVSATYRCLAALRLGVASRHTFEVVVVDDGSSDRTTEIAEFAPGVRVVRHEVAQGFNGAVTAGVAVARGAYVALLNNDTEPMPGWLDELVDATSRFTRAGLVGSRLIYPNGRLQEAGGLVWDNGEPVNVGNRSNPWNPRFSYARQVDYLSGAALLMPTEVWHEVGGLSPEFAPAYFEDTDLAFKVRDHGYTTWYVPSSVVLHHEGLSNGTDVETTSGLKRFQEINRPTFVEKWREAFAGQGRMDVDDLNLVKDRNIAGRVLFIDSRTPRPDQDAGSYAAVQEALLVQSLGFKITFAPVDMTYSADYTDDLTRLGIEVIHTPYFGTVREFLEARGPEFDAVYITRYNVALDVLDAVRLYAPDAPVLFNNADLHFLRLARAAAVTDAAEDWEEAETVREAELDVMRRVEVVLSYNEVEHAVIASHNLAASKVVLCPWVVAARDDDRVPPHGSRQGIAFLGGYRHPPNVDAAHFFATEVMPLVAEELPGVPFYIYGSALPESLMALESDTIRPMGFVDSTALMHDQHRVFVAPLRSGAGIKGKVLGALADGIPSVLSPLAAEATGVRPEVDALIASTPQEWAQAVVALYRDEHRWNAVSRSGLGLMRERYSFEHGRVAMAAALTTAGVEIPAEALTTPGPVRIESLRGVT